MCQLVPRFFTVSWIDAELVNGSGREIGNIHSQFTIQQKRCEILAELVLKGTGGGGVNRGQVVFTALESGLNFVHQSIDSGKRKVDFEQNGVAEMGECR